MTAYTIRTYAREDLELFLEKGRGPFSPEDIRAELARRDVFVNALKNDPLKYPELQKSFH